MFSPASPCFSSYVDYDARLLDGNCSSTHGAAADDRVALPHLHLHRLFRPYESHHSSYSRARLQHSQGG